MRCARCNGELVAEGHYWDFSTEEREIKRYTSCRLQARTTPEAQYNTFVIVEVYCSNCFHHLMPKEKREYIKEGNVKIAENSELYSEDEAKDAAKHLIYRQQSFRDAKKHTKKSKDGWDFILTDYITPKEHYRSLYRKKINRGIGGKNKTDYLLLNGKVLFVHYFSDEELKELYNIAKKMKIIVDTSLS